MNGLYNLPKCRKYHPGISHQNRKDTNHIILMGKHGGESRRPVGHTTSTVRSKEEQTHSCCEVIAHFLNSYTVCDPNTGGLDLSTSVNTIKVIPHRHGHREN